MSLRIWPQGLIGRVILVLMCAVLAEFIGSSLLYERLDLHVTRAEQAHHLAEQFVTAERMLEAMPREQRDTVARNLSTAKAKVRWRPAPALPVEQKSGALRSLVEDMQVWEPSLRGRDLRLDRQSGKSPFSPGKLGGSLTMRDGSAVLVVSANPSNPWAFALAALGSSLVLSGVVLLAGVVLLRNIGAPLRALEAAAENIGEGAPVYLQEEGAADVRRVARAFNAMQTRITGLLTARTNALAAVSHDLRTPLSRMRLRAGLVENAETRAALEQDVDEMNAMLSSLLAYLGGANESEPRRLTDLAALCMTLVEGASDAGSEADYSGLDHLAAEIRPIAVRRAISNLIENAIHYGGRADVSLHREGAFAVVRVEDRGPGIPEKDMQRVRQAFERLDDARGRNTAGLGLGLNIVDNVARQEGGALLLSNLPAGGLRAEFRLPIG